MLDFYEHLRACAPQVHPHTMKSIIEVESSFNPFAIGVVGNRLKHQPTTQAEAIATARFLDASGHNYSVGLAQVNVKNFTAHGLTLETAFDVCHNLRAGSEILADCFRRALRAGSQGQVALKDALSCYYTGDLKRGHKLGYVAKIVAAAGRPPLRSPAVNLSLKVATVAPIALRPVRARKPHNRVETDTSEPLPSARGSALIF